MIRKVWSSINTWASPRGGNTNNLLFKSLYMHVSFRSNLVFENHSPRVRERHRWADYSTKLCYVDLKHAHNPKQYDRRSWTRQTSALNRFEDRRRVNELLPRPHQLPQQHIIVVSLQIELWHCLLDPLLPPTPSAPYLSKITSSIHTYL
jgi:hypothetical protein